MSWYKTALRTGDCFKYLSEQMPDTSILEWRLLERRVSNGGTIIRLCEHVPTGDRFEVRERHGSFYSIRPSNSTNDLPDERPEDYYFAVVQDRDSWQPYTGWTIFISPINFWSNHHYLDDRGTPDSVRSILENFGLREEAESTFIPVGDLFRRAAVYLGLIRSGFVNGDAFQRWCNQEFGS